MRRDIEVSDGQEDQVSKGLQTPESRGPVLHDLEQAVDAFAHGVGERVFNERDDVVKVITQGDHKGLQRGQPTSEGGRHPALQERLGRTDIFEVPDVVKLIFQNPGAMDAPVGGAQRV